MSSPAVPLKKKSPEHVIEDAILYITENKSLSDVDSIGDLLLPKGSLEAERCGIIKGILKEYATRERVSCPLSLALFGPPGSGKSFFVRQILASAGEHYEKPIVVNLSQLSDLRDLAEFFDKVAAGKGDPMEKIKVLFFDEFDSPLNGEQLGWLRLFLGPMQDSEFYDQKRVIKFTKALFVFAGGTATSRKEFEERAMLDPANYRNKKVPDFMSRLRGFIDIQGINTDDENRPLRRALVLRHQLAERWPKRLGADGKFPIHPELIRSLLTNVHYIHGVRSMEALLDMSHLPEGELFELKHLPDESLKELHLSRGPLDGKTIGISAGLFDTKAGDLLLELAQTLLRSGASLAYGGNFVPDGTLQKLANAAMRFPADLVPPKGKRIVNYLGFPSFNKPDAKALSPDLSAQVQILPLRTLSEAEMKDLQLKDDWFQARPGKEDSSSYNWRHHLAWAISMFRMRLRMIQDVTALIVVGGKSGESWGRFSGIAEEVALGIALGKPVYVLGGWGGAARDVGRLLGLDETIVSSDDCLEHSEGIGPPADQKKFAGAFQVPGHPEVPQTVSEIRKFLFDHSVMTNKWWNGLEEPDNRKLFTSEIKDHRTCIELIMRGLSRLSWKTSGPRGAARAPITHVL